MLRVRFLLPSVGLGSNVYENKRFVTSVRKQNITFFLGWNRFRALRCCGRSIYIVKHNWTCFMEWNERGSSTYRLQLTSYLRCNHIRVVWRCFSQFSIFFVWLKSFWRVTNIFVRMKSENSYEYIWKIHTINHCSYFNVHNVIYASTIL